MILHVYSEKLQHVKNLSNCDLLSKHKFFIIKLDVKGGVAIFSHAAQQVSTELTALCYKRGINYRKVKI